MLSVITTSLDSWRNNTLNTRNIDSLTVDMIHVITHALSATFDSGHDTDVIMHALSATFNSDLCLLYTSDAADE